MDCQMATDSAIDLSASSSSSLCDVLPDLRKAGETQRLTRRRARAESMSSALSSIIDSDQSSDLSDVTDSEAEKPQRKRNRQYSPEPLEDSEESEDEASGAILKPGKKRYLRAGLYSASFKDPVAESTFTIEISQQPLDRLNAVPLALPASVPIDIEDETDSTPEPVVEGRKREARQASSLANQKFTRNGAGLSIHAKQKAPKKKAVAPTASLASTYVCNGTLLPLPINFGESLINTKSDFKLAFNIMRDYSQGSMGRQRVFERAGADKRHPRYQLLQQNMYVERNKFPAENPAICQCKPGSKCEEDCINRLMLYLCSPKLCPAGKSCTNTPLSSRKPMLDRKGREAAVPFWTGNRGFGLKTTVDLEEGDFIMEYRGEIISRDESYRRVLNEYKSRHDYYFLDYDGEEVIDAGLKGNAARFANHSCGPNCKMIRFRLADCDEWQVGLFATQDIAAGAELTYNYGWVTFASLADSASEEDEGGEPVATVAESDNPKAKQQRCYCGAKQCSGFLGAKRKSDNKIVAKGKGKPKGKASAHGGDKRKR